MPPGIYRTFRNLSDHDARLLVLIQGDENMSDTIEMPRSIGEEVRQKYGDKLLELLAAINMRFQGEDTEDFSNEQMEERVARTAGVQPQTTPNDETIYSIMAPDPGGPARVKNWPGMTVAKLVGEPGQVTQAKVEPGCRQWVINLEDGTWEVDCDGQRTVLGRFDMVCAEAGSVRTLRGPIDERGRVLLVTQSQQTTVH